MITKDKFDAYEWVRRSGDTNMWDIRTVISLAEDYGVELTKLEVLEIMKRYDELSIKFQNEKEG